MSNTDTGLSRRWQSYWVHARFQEWGDLVYARPIATAILVLVGHSRWVTPNGLTVAALIVRAATLAFLLAMPGTAPVAVAAALLLAVAIDGADGQLARARGGGSALGSYVDKVSDLVWQALLFGALGWLATRSAGDPLYLLLAASAFAANACAYYAYWVYRGEQSARGGDAGQSIGSFGDDRPPLTFKKVLRIQAYVLAFQESDIHLWIGVGLCLGRLDWICWFLALTQVPSGVIRIVARGRQLR